MFDLIITVIVSMSITLLSMLAGYKLAMWRQRIQDIRFFEEITIEDWLSDTPIANALDRKYDV